MIQMERLGESRRRISCWVLSFVLKMKFRFRNRRTGKVWQ